MEQDAEKCLKSTEDHQNDLQCRKQQLQHMEDEIEGNTRGMTLENVPYVIDNQNRYTFGGPISEYDLLSLTRRITSCQLGDQRLNVFGVEVRRFLQLTLSPYDHEVFAVMYLDEKNRLIKYEKLFHGDAQRVKTPTKEIILNCFNHNAAGILFAHNHPVEGIAAPSQEDHKSTITWCSVLLQLGISLLDHVIVTREEIFSFHDHGLLQFKLNFSREANVRSMRNRPSGSPAAGRYSKR